MAWSNSKVFAAFVLNALDRGVLYDLDGDTLKAALYDNDITPDRTVAIANTAYNAGQWTASGNEVTDTGWPAGGQALASNDVTQSSDVVKLDATDTASTGNVTAYLFDFGDGTTSDWVVNPAVEHIYMKAGKYSPKLKVRNAQGQESYFQVGPELSVKAAPDEPAQSPLLLGVVAFLAIAGGGTRCSSTPASTRSSASTPSAPRRATHCR